jgi:ATP-dependent exoDNAse (exonuclease V) beta subunit
MLGRKPPFGVRRDDLIVRDVPKPVVADGRRVYDQWKLTRADARAAGSRPSLVVTTAREWAAQPLVDGADALDSQAAESGHTDIPAVPVDVVWAEQERGYRSSGGAAFGLLVHDVLAEIPLDADRALISRAAAQQARILGLSSEFTDAAADTVVRVLEHDVMARARDAERRGECRRETPIVCPLPDGTIIEGVVDLAFREGDRWTVVDFKTDREISEAGEERYRRQLAVYCAAIARSTGENAVGTILRI